MCNRLLTSTIVLAALATAAPTFAEDPAGLRLAQSAAPESTSPARYRLLQIVQPKNAETIHDNTGAVPVEVAMHPTLDSKAGHRLRVTLDEALLPGAWTTTRFTLQQVERGTHRLQVIVVDGDGRTLGQSATIEFYMWQASRLFPQRSPR